jgi:hypothetical protein
MGRGEQVGLITSIRRGAGRAAFEADRLMRVNRVRAEIGTLHARVAEEERQMGSRLVDLYQAGMLAHPELEPACERVLQLRGAIRERTADLDAVLEEAAPAGAWAPKRLS